MTELLCIALILLAAYAWHQSLRVAGAHQRISEWRDFTWKLEKRLVALEAGALKRRPERGDNGRFVSQKGAVRNPSGSE